MTNFTRPKSVWWLYSILLLFLIPMLTRGDSRLRLKRADVLENITVDGAAVQILEGNVIFVKGLTTLTGDRARFYEKSGQGHLTGNVVVTKEERTLECDSLFYDSVNEVLKAYGNTHIWDKDYDLVADSLIYYSELDSGIALGNVRLNQVDQQITADRILYSKRAGQDAVSYKALGDVTILEGNRIATCGEADYSREDEVTILKINPRVKEEDRILTGEEIVLSYRDEVLERIFIPAQAHAVITSSGWRSEPTTEDTITSRQPVSYQDDMTSSVFIGFFKDGKLDSIRLEGMATTLYHIFDDSLYQGKNLASGDTIAMRFEESELKRIIISGGARGTYTPDSTNVDVEAPIDYESETIDYFIPEEKTDLYRNAKIHYTDIDLSAGFINVNWQNNLLYALPISPGDSTGEAIQPTLLERGREPMVGDTMIYNLETRKGKVVHGRTKAEDGYYAGHEIRNEGNKTFYVKNSTFTTCDLKVPHFHFESRKMKMIQNDKVIARPLILYISGIPIIGLPFAIFPNQKGGRHSGWIMPSYGESRNRGQFIDGMGYYWAPNDYWDTKLLLSFADRQGITFRIANNYKKRYRYSGAFYLETRQFLGFGERDITSLSKNRKTDYVVRWNHRQVLRGNQSFNANASYYSNGEYNRIMGLDPVRRMNQQAISNVTYSKQWKKWNSSLSLNVSSKRDLMVEQKIEPSSVFYQKPKRAGTQLNILSSTLPSMTFRRGQSPLIKSKSNIKKWYHNITWNYSNKLTNQIRTYYESEEIALDDTTTTFQWQVDRNGKGIVKTTTSGILVHNFSVSAPQKIFRYITISPGFSGKSDWVNKSFSARLDTATNTLIKEEVDGLAIRTTGSFRLSASTQIYGLFPVGIGALKSIRHVVSPSIGYSYTPDFSKPLFGKDLGYFQTFRDTAGNVLTYDRFRETPAGSTPQKERQAINFALNNVFQAKVSDGDKERKIDLLSWRLSTNYNFVAETYKLANLQSSLRSSLARKLRLDLSMTHDFYDYDSQRGERSTSLRKNAWGLPVPRLINARLSTGFKISGKRLTPQTEPTAAVTDTTIDTTADEERLDASGVVNPAKQVTKPLPGKDLWQTNVSFSYAYNRADPQNPVKTFWMNTNTKIQITPNWRIQYNARFDLVKNELVSHHFSIYRDLHCWEMSVSWT
ncbi:MAG: hypothetical protein GXO92_06250, partial [FCB group bacterium]|nr:hypothetical protein [FCB group bacterium]